MSSMLADPNRGGQSDNGGAVEAESFFYTLPGKSLPEFFFFGVWWTAPPRCGVCCPCWRRSRVWRASCMHVAPHDLSARTEEQSLSQHHKRFASAGWCCVRGSRAQKESSSLWRGTARIYGARTWPTPPPTHIAAHSVHLTLVASGVATPHREAP